MTIFREATKCTKALVNTFVATFGVVDGMQKSIVNSEVTLNELLIDLNRVFVGEVADPNGFILCGGIVSLSTTYF